MRIYTTAEMLVRIQSFPATLLRLADGKTLEGVQKEHLGNAAQIMFHGGNTAVDVMVPA